VGRTNSGRTMLQHALSSVLEGADDESFHGAVPAEVQGESTGSLNIRPFNLDAVRALVLLNVQVGWQGIWGRWAGQPLPHHHQGIRGGPFPLAGRLRSLWPPRSSTVAVARALTVCWGAVWRGGRGRCSCVEGSAGKGLP
jgi:hypothetical protein